MTRPIVSLGKRLVLLVATLLLLGGAASASGAGSEAGDPGASARRAVVVVLNGISWNDIERSQVPALRHLIQLGSIGLLSTRVFGFPEQDGAFETLGAGSRAVSPSRCADALSRWEQYQGDTAAALYQRLSGMAAGDAEVLVPRITSVLSDNRKVRYLVRPGLLGDTLAQAGLSTAVLGNEDTSLSYAPSALHRGVAAVAMTGEGQVRWGDVGKDLLISNGGFGAATNGPALAQRFGECYRRASLVVVDLGDTGRALANGGWESSLVRSALEREDGNLQLLLDKVDWGRTRLYVLSPTADVTGRHPFAPIVVYGAGVPAGLLSSATTGQSGLVCNIDLLPSILEFLQVPLPGIIYGRQIGFDAGKQAGRLDSLLKREGEASVALSVRPAVVTVLAVCVFLALALGVIAFRCPRMKSMARKGLTLTLGLVFGLVVVPMLLPMRYGIGPFAAALVAVVVGALLTPTRRAETLLVGMGLGMFVVLCGDQLLGTNLELDTPLGSSSVAALRFYGMGNDLMAFTLASCLLFVPRLLKNRRPPGARELGLLGALFLLTTLLLGAPTFGANVGGTLTVGATLALALVLLARGRIGWEGWVGAFAAASVLLGACILLDLHRPLSVQTHLARNISYVQEGGLHQVWRVVVEKAQLNRRMLTFSPIAPLFIPIFLAMFYAVLRPARAFRPLFSEKPHFYSCLKAAMIGSVIGALTKDSGIIIAMLIFSLLAPATFLLALSPRSEKTAGSN